MSQRLYDASTAEALMKFAYPEYDEHDLKPYEIREDGVYAVDTFRHLCPPGTIYDWTPADEMEWPGSPNPDTAPFLPIPFNAAQLAAAMIDGPGQSIVHAMGRHLGYPLDIDALNRFPDRMRWMREALAEAYAVAAAAQSVVGAFDHQAEAHAYKLAQQHEDSEALANERESVFDWNATEDEKNQRRQRAISSVAHLKAQAEQARSEANAKWRDWRNSMVMALLAPAPAAPPELVAAETTQEQRQARRWQLCIDAGLPMPADTYSHLPRGIGKVAKELKITRQALQQDLNAHRERLFDK